MYTGGTIALIVSYVVSLLLVLAYGWMCYRSNQQRREDIDMAVGDMDWLDKTDGEIKGFKYTT